MDEAVHERSAGYREPAPPSPRRFRLRTGTAALASLALGLGSIAVSALLVYLTGALLVVFFAALGPWLANLVAGMPHTIELRHDSVVLRSWFRPPRRIPAGELVVQRSRRHVVLAHGGRAVLVRAEDVADGRFDDLAQALAAHAGRIVDVSEPGA